jgi:hypothetical protein
MIANTLPQTFFKVYNAAVLALMIVVVVQGAVRFAKQFRKVSNKLWRIRSMGDLIFALNQLGLLKIIYDVLGAIAVIILLFVVLGRAR